MNLISPEKMIPLKKQYRELLHSFRCINALVLVDFLFSYMIVSRILVELWAYQNIESASIGHEMHEPPYVHSNV